MVVPAPSISIASPAKAASRLSANW
ncbi:hypothetical protein OG2516_18455 [Oceanicola granulosus HTCC2516]|uniref:Uncharacterized protein n=1 Tax=Oceanicola granulosus (strain ATCC BAA-861 / DSM 15982 / KCTC 12143 / HTCC2516) TaxID=314256 RepID=Q2CHG5_OCEGH|nr:hypothetical protein OG2516_18455 [Oceanicola granulosus HTCC2516]